MDSEMVPVYPLMLVAVTDSVPDRPSAMLIVDGETLMLKSLTVIEVVMECVKVPTAPVTVTT